MEANIFLQKNKSKQSVNTSNGVNISLVGKRRLLPTNDFADVISQYDIYNEERQKCNKIRLTCQVNTICSNVLFNSITEIVKNEGSPNVSFLNYGIFKDLDGNVLTDKISDKIAYKEQTPAQWTQHNAIMDTQISNDGYVYHCGLDIFNNHLIRSKTFKAICKRFGESSNQDFNTINDTMRDIEGNQVMEKMYYPLESGMSNPKAIGLHVYEYDDIYTFQDCVANRLEKSFDGWLGFINRAKIKTYKDYKDNAELEINKPLMYKNANDFVDMYPDRSLYSFTPKYNDFRNRIEKNWNYCITYPSSSTTSGFTDIINEDVNSLKAIYFNENTYADNGTRQLVIYSIAKHGLAVGDYVNIYNGSEMVLENAKVTAIANEFIFTVFSDVQISKKWVETSGDSTMTVDGVTYQMFANKYFYAVGDAKKYYIVEDKYVNLDEDAQNISYKKVVNGIECEYYVRIFSKVPNFRFASGDTSSEYEIYKNNGEKIRIYQDKEYDFESHVSSLAFAKNVYGDDISELVFTDDIDISNLRDNLGRPLTTVYLTIVKNNSGYKEWYGYDVNYSLSGESLWTVSGISSTTVEFSHCFGRISCGLVTSEESQYDNDIKSINKLNENNYYGYDIDIINGDRDGLYPLSGTYYINSSEVWFDIDKHYYGDLCCYDNYNAIEQSIQPILHRFNTAQRECKNSKSSQYFKQFQYERIKEDDFDYHSSQDKTYIIDSVIYNTIGNTKYEGYYYNPHHEIRIKSLGKIETVMPDVLSITSMRPAGEGKINFTCLTNHYLSIGDKTILYDTIGKKYYNCVTIQGSDDSNKSYTCLVYDGNDNIIDYSDCIILCNKDLNDIRVIKMDNIDCPSYARILNDGTCRVIWRNVVNNGFGEDKSIEEYPFTNGAFYVNKKIDLYLRRQDPYNIWGLYSEDDISGKSYNIEDEDNYVKDTEIIC